MWLEWDTNLVYTWLPRSKKQKPNRPKHWRPTKGKDRARCGCDGNWSRWLDGGDTVLQISFIAHIWRVLISDAIATSNAWTSASALKRSNASSTDFVSTTVTLTKVFNSDSLVFDAVPLYTIKLSASELQRWRDHRALHFSDVHSVLDLSLGQEKDGGWCVLVQRWPNHR